MLHSENEGVPSKERLEFEPRIGIQLSEQEVRVLLTAALDAVDVYERMALEERAQDSTEPEDIERSASASRRLQKLRSAIGELQRHLLNNA